MKKTGEAKNVKLLLVVIGTSLGLFVAGCGYTTRAYVQATGYKTIYVEPFVNSVDTTSEYSEGRRFKTYFPLLEQKITNAVVDRYIFDGNLKIAKKEEADLVLKGALVNYRRDSLRDSTEDVPQEYRVTIFVNITLSDKKANKVLWEMNSFAGDASYYTTGSFVKSDAQAVQDATDDLARRIVERTVEAW
ncbi:MAG: LptE family protein [Candidatus Omnitrophota bacterium]